MTVIPQHGKILALLPKPDALGSRRPEKHRIATDSQPRPGSPQNVDFFQHISVF
jgi:hypothetical protein